MEKSVYLIGELNENFIGRKLPTNGEVMSVFLYEHKLNKLTLKKSACVTVKKVEEKWLQAGLTISKSCNAIKKMLKLFNTWLKLKKNQYRKKSSTQKKSESLFVEKSGKLFDIAQSNLMEKLDENKKLFLASQRSDKRYGFIDANASNKQVDEPTMEIDNDDLNQHTASGSNNYLGKNSLSRNQSTAGTETTTSSQRSENISEYQVSPEKQNAPPKIDVMNAELASALDRANISNGNATYVLTAAYKSVGINIETLNLSCSTIRRARIMYRQSITEDLKDEFQLDDRYIVHWDGKILTDIVDPKSVDRIAILLSSMKVRQLLGVPKIFDGSAETHSVAVLNTLNKWNVTPYIKAMCFDTTAVNTGLRGGIAALIERKLNRKLIWLPCRHHIFEIVLRSVFDVYWPVTSGPNVSIFGRFKTFWDQIDQSNYETGIQDEIVNDAVKAERIKIVMFINNQLAVCQPRNDYKELLELALIFLDGLPERANNFKRPGAMHHARWMAKAIYCLKIFMFRNQFPLSKQEINNLRHVCTFVILVYIRVWFTCSLAIQAPNNDLEMLKKLLHYKDINQLVSQKALKKIGDHMWYLNEELAPLALFDNNVSDEIKTKMCVAMLQNPESKLIKDKRYVAEGKKLESFLEKDLSAFVSTKSLTLFQLFDLPYDFLNADVKMWSKNESYKENLEFFRGLTVVNDVAERGIALIEDYNNCLTKNEEQLQYLLQVVQEHRRRFPNFNKTTLK